MCTYFQFDYLIFHLSVWLSYFSSVFFHSVTSFSSYSFSNFLHRFLFILPCSYLFIDMLMIFMCRFLVLHLLLLYLIIILQLSRIIYLFSSNMHDASLSLSIHTTCARLMLNLVQLGSFLPRIFHPYISFSF